MKIVKKIKGYFKKSFGDLDPFFDLRHNGDLDINRANRLFATETQQLLSYKKLPWISACVEFIRAGVSGQEFFFTNKDGDIVIPPKNITEPFENGYFNLSFNDMLGQAAAHMLFTGNALWIKSFDNAFNLINGITSQFIPIIPGRFLPKVSNDGFVLEGYDIRDAQGKNKIFQNDDVIHFMASTIASPFFGVGKVEQAATALEAEFESDRLHRDVLVNGTYISLFLSMKQKLGEEGLRHLRDYLRLAFTKGKGRGGILAADDDAKITQLGTSHKDLQVIEFKNHIRDLQLASLGLPPEVLGLANNSNRATMLGSKSIAANTINNKLLRLEDAINHQYMRLIAPDIIFKIKKIKIADIEKIINMMNNGLITPNQASEMAGVNNDSEDEILNQFFIPSNLVQLTGIDNETQNRKEDQEDKSLFFDKSTYTYDVDKIIKYSEKSATKPKRFQFKYIRAFMQARNKIERLTFDILSKFFEDQGKRFSKSFADSLQSPLSKSKSNYSMKNLQNEGVSGEDIVILSFSMKEENEILEDVMDTTYKTSLELNILAVEKSSNKKLSDTGRKLYAVQAFDRLKSILTTGGNIDKNFSVNDTTRQDMITLINKSIELGDNVNETQDKIIAKFEQYSDFRARRIARTELSHAHNSAAHVS